MLVCEKIFKLTRKITKSTTRWLRELKTPLSKCAARFKVGNQFQQEADSQVQFMFFNGSSSRVGSKVWNQFLQEADSKFSSCFFNGSNSKVGSPRSGTSFYRRLIPSPIQVFSMCRPCDPGTREPAPNLKPTYWLSPVLTSLILFVLVLALL